MFDIVSYEEARTVNEAVSMLTANPHAKLIAGGTDILLKVRAGKLPRAQLVGIRNISELKEITRDKHGTISIGAAATFDQIAVNPRINKDIPILAQAVTTVGGPQIRRMATIGGNVCNGATSADSGPSLFVLNAKLKITGPDGTRETPITHFYKDAGRVDLRTGEILTAIVVRSEDYQGFTGKYIKYSRRKAMDIATLGCAVLCQLTEERRFAAVRLAFSVAAPTPIRCPSVEAWAVGKEFTWETAEEFGSKAACEINPRTSWRATREFRLHLAGELAKQALIMAVSKGEEDSGQ